MNKDMANRASRTEKAEGDRWSSDSSTVERRDVDRPESGADTDTGDLDTVNRTRRDVQTPRRYDEPETRTKS